MFGHPAKLVGDGKNVKIKGYAIHAERPVRHFGVDEVRYFWSTPEMPFAQDGTITWELTIERVNSDLANVLGKSGKPHHFDVE